MKVFYNEVSNEIYQSIIEHNPDSIFVLSVDGKIIEVNKMVTTILGYLQEEVQGIYFHNLIVSSEREKIQLHVTKALEGTPLENNMEVFHKLGGTLCLQVKTIPLTVGNEVVGIFCVAKDMTKLLKMQVSLDQIEEKYKALFTSTADAIDILNLDESISEINPEFEKLYGWKREEIIGNPLPMIPDFLLPESKYLIERAKLGEEIRGYVTTRMRKDGTPIEISLTLSPIRDAQGKVLAISGASRDITKQRRLEKSLKDSEERYRKVVEFSPTGVLVHRNGTILYANPSALNTLKEVSLTDKSIFTYIHSDYQEIYKNRIAESEIEKEIPFIEIEMVRQDGALIFAEVKGVPIIYGDLPAILMLFNDVTDRKETEKALLDSEKHYRLLAENSLDLIQLVNLDGIVTFASPSHQTVLGYKPEKYVGKWVFYQPNSCIDNHLKNAFLNMAKTRRPFTCEINRKHRDGYDIWIELQGKPVFDEKGDFRYLMLVGRDITERKKQQKYLEYLSYYDALTGIPNRRLFKERLKQTLKEAKRYQRKFAVIYMDMDKFKQINDHFGHKMGDELLKQFSERVKRHLRETDIFARQGGDEFTILLTELQDEKEAQEVAERILFSLQEPWEIGKDKFQTTCSIGIALYPKDGTTRYELMEHADTALYEAKDKGRNNIKVYVPLNGDRDFYY